jgi:hypothetical protein
MRIAVSQVAQTVEGEATRSSAEVRTLDQGSGEHILTIDTPVVRNALRYLTSLHNRAGKDRCGGLHREAE